MTTAEYQNEEYWTTVSADGELYCKTWIPKETPVACVLFIHGFSDHINRFQRFFGELVQARLQIFGFDQRGWGRSVKQKSQRGQTGPTAMVLDDISEVLRTVLSRAAGLKVPIFLMGHSMGGAEVLTYAAVGPSDLRRQIRGYAALAPYIALHPSSQPSRLLVMAGKAAKMVVPNMHMVQKLRPELLCRDVEVGKEWERDELCHNTGTLEGLNGMIERGANLDSDAVQVVEGSIYVAHGSSDMITDHDTSQRWVQRLNVQDKQFKSYPGWYHVLHAEPGNDAEIFARDVAAWIVSRSSSNDLQSI